MPLTKNKEQQLRIVFQHLQEASKIIHDINVEKGFWEKTDSKEKLLLIHSEVSEAVEALRKDVFEKDKHLPDYYNHDVEIADILIRVLDYAYAFCPGYFPQIVAEKVIYNSNRPVKHGGKKF